MKSVEGGSQGDPPRQKCHWLMDGRVVVVVVMTIKTKFHGAF